MSDNLIRGLLCVGIFLILVITLILKKGKMPMTDIQETKERVHENIKEIFDTSSFMTFSQTFLYFIESSSI